MIRELRQKLFDKMKDLMIIEGELESAEKRLFKLKKEVNSLYEKLDEALDK